MKQMTATNILVFLCLLAYGLESLLVGEHYSGFELFYFESPQFQPVQLLSHMFLHGGITHLLFNMLGLWIFGNAVERVCGFQRLFIFYFLCGLGAAFIYQGVNFYQYQSAIEPLLSVGMSQQELTDAFINYKYFPQLATSQDALIIFATPVVGASGALYGLLVAFACLFPNKKMILIFLPFPIAAKFFVPVLLALDLFSGVTGFPIFGDNVAHAAHIGGAITGFILALLYATKRPLS